MKRLMDITISAFALVILAPVMVAIAIAVRLTMGSPVLFRQRRPGLHGRTFTMLKFRTMSGTRDAEGHLLPDGERLTRLGRFLRSASLDELPELINVLRGEMSLVGPRPLLVRYLPYYSESERERFRVLPGITGWAQVHGRNDLPWSERLALDTWYVDNRSLKLDLKILRLTLRQVLRRENVHINPTLTMLDLDEERK